MAGRLPGGWDVALDGDASAAFDRALEAVEAARERGIEVFPPRDRWLFALEATPVERVQVVVLGQDPYHQPGQAMGLAFSVARGVPVPPSLRNVFKELHADLGIAPPGHGDLTSWAERGVLLLNTVLTVERSTPGAHAGRGWEVVTDAVIRHAARLSARPLVFMLWGAHAGRKAALIEGRGHLVLHAAHPSPLSARGFLGCRHFSTANAFLDARGGRAVRWNLPP